jgi:Ni,Fe-hydrogenase I large subunit
LNVGAAGAPVAFEVGPLARMVVMGVIQDGVALASTVPNYMLYTKTNAAVTGLDPAMIEADLALALVSAPVPLATVQTDSATYTTRADCLAHYNDATAVIMGPIRDWVIGLEGGISTMDRLRGRAIESLWLVIQMIGAPTKGATGLAPMTWVSNGWIDDLRTYSAPVGASNGTYIHKVNSTGSGFGGCEAPRGALMHFITVDKGRISKYQCVVPTTWNGSPKDSAGNPGAIEAAMIGIPFSNAGASFTNQAGGTTNTQGGVEALRVAQSFDPCIACAVH